MKIQSLIANSTKTRLKLQSKWERNNNRQKIHNNSKSILLINNLHSKQNQQKCSIHIPSQKKFNTFTQFPNNRKNSITKSNPSLQKKIDTGIKQKICGFIEEGFMMAPNNEVETQSRLQLAYQVYEKFILKRIVWQAEQWLTTIKKRDLVLIIAIALNPNMPLESAQYLRFFADLLKNKNDKKTSESKQKKNIKGRLRVCSSTSNVSYIPQRNSKAKVFTLNECKQKHKQEQVEKKLSSHHSKINQIRESILSQQNLLTNIKNGPRNKHSSKLHPDDLRILSCSNQTGKQECAALEYVLQQNELLMRFAGQQFNKYESQICEYGVILQTKHLQIDLDYQEFTANNDQESSVQIFKDSITKQVLNTENNSAQKCQLILDAFAMFYDNIQAKNGKLKQLIEIKSTIISQFSSKMELWIQNLVYKKEFNDNLAKYIQRQSEYTQLSLLNMAHSLQSISQSYIATKMEKLKKSLQLFFQNILKSHQFS